MPKLKSVKPREMIRLLESKNFQISRTKGSHVILVKHNAAGKKLVVIPRHNRPLRKGTLLAILRQAGLRKEDL